MIGHVNKYPLYIHNNVFSIYKIMKCNLEKNKHNTELQQLVVIKRKRKQIHNARYITVLFVELKANISHKAKKK